MSDDREIAKRALDFQARGRDYPLTRIAGYTEWSKRKLQEGGNEALIAHLDATSMWLTPEELTSVTESMFEEMFEELRESLGDGKDED